MSGASTPSVFGSAKSSTASGEESKPASSVTPNVPKELGTPDANGIYSYDDLTPNVLPLYYKFNQETKKWQWSPPDKSVWMLTSITKVAGGYYGGSSPSQANIDIINKLEADPTK